LDTITGPQSFSLSRVSMQAPPDLPAPQMAKLHRA